jgi:hypothetical protein
MAKKAAKRTKAARERNPRLGRAYDLLRGWQVGFFNDKLAPDGTARRPADR